MAAELLQPLIASGLRLDTFEGRAWVSVSPFTMWGIRPIFFPPLPVLSQSHELNVRTYVHVEVCQGSGSSRSMPRMPLPSSERACPWASRTFGRACACRSTMLISISRPLACTLGRQRSQFEGTWSRGEPLPRRRPTHWISSR